jgi:hypothetical protein
MLAIAFVLAMLGMSPDCIPATEETLALYSPDRQICLAINR